MMKKQTNSTSQIIFIGIMLFALFFGAGNLIFPVQLGQDAGDHVWQASLGFVVTGVLLPLLGVIALGYSGESDFLKLSQRAGVLFGLILATALYLSIGPLFAMPRTGTVSFIIGVKPFISDASNLNLAQWIFTAIYFGLSCLLSINPHRIVDIVGKVLTPLMLIFIAILVISAIVLPMGEPGEALKADYQHAAFFTGFTNGYLTMDTLASCIFGMIVIYHILELGLKGRSAILSASIKSSLIAAALLALVYVSLAYLGATSVSTIGQQQNGGDVLALTSVHYFGTAGNLILGVIVIMACLTTSIGLTTACSNYFHKLLPAVSYRVYAVIFSITSMLFANIGLDQLIAISVPVLFVVYPLTIVLIALTFMHKMFNGNKAVYIGALYCTLCISIFSGLDAAGYSITSVNAFLHKYLPLYDVNVGWILPAIFGGVVGYLYSLSAAKKTQSVA